MTEPLSERIKRAWGRAKCALGLHAWDTYQRAPFRLPLVWTSMRRCHRRCGVKDQSLEVVDLSGARRWS